MCFKKQYLKQINWDPEERSKAIFVSIQLSTFGALFSYDRTSDR